MRLQGNGDRLGRSGTDIAVYSGGAHPRHRTWDSTQEPRVQSVSHTTGVDRDPVAPNRAKEALELQPRA